MKDMDMKDRKKPGQDGEVLSDFDDDDEVDEELQGEVLPDEEEEARELAELGNPSREYTLLKIVNRN